ncbi:unnamed protein product [Bursaphelenchus okinawaensis]|uniref:Uncharacterized protein n=1 Tax=Bursaphelenchus okinawaensis TaxID=465554 RepID=A0A811L3X5_9BILA|nr:unnamed protein product [Bursaphelenchus okinawaensis]CAG9118905.1 unnamed protein product [Bursaphelenchus okinawaensis]
MLKGVRLVSLDVTNTLLGLREAPGSTYSRLAAKYGINCYSELITRRFPAAFKRLELEKPAYDFAGNGSLGWWRQLLDEVCVEQKDHAKFGDFYIELYRHYYVDCTAWTLLDGKIYGYFDQLHELNIGVGVISNFDERLRIILQSFNLMDKIDYLILSGEVGVQKPNKKIFKMLHDMSGIADNSEIVHIGDNMEKDYIAAKNCGFRSILYDPKKKHVDNKEVVRVTNFQEIFEC